jgi:hypothetical protein
VNVAGWVSSWRLVGYGVFIREERTSGAEAQIFVGSTARLKSCPDTKHEIRFGVEGNCRSLDFARDDKGEGGFQLGLVAGVRAISSRYIESDRWGFAHRFRPTYALANVGHPSHFL